ncbi:MAG TPA: CheR family methyltransferase, partial [Vicinamibacterales bacterium]
RDLLRETPPSGRHDLIVCRNVLIYFDRETQERLFDMFYESLAPNGFLSWAKWKLSWDVPAHASRPSTGANASFNVCDP